MILDILSIGQDSDTEICHMSIWKIKHCKYLAMARIRMAAPKKRNFRKAFYAHIRTTPMDELIFFGSDSAYLQKVSGKVIKKARDNVKLKADGDSPIEVIEF